MNARYFEKPEHVLFINPIVRFLSKIFGAKRLVVRCKTCGKIPTDLYGSYCLDHFKEINTKK